MAPRRAQAKRGVTHRRDEVRFSSRLTRRLPLQYVAPGDSNMVDLLIEAAGVKEVEERLADALAGMVGKNTGLNSTEVAAFGGVKQSRPPRRVAARAR